MQVGFTTLRELVALRMPVRKAALAILLDMTTHPGASHECGVGIPSC